ncbi:MAG: beta-propeller fold lactonase family protein, partial [Kibdelosporangium sp.]
MENSEKERPSSDPYGRQQPTQGFAAYQSTPPSAPQGGPGWLTAPPPRRRRRGPLFLAVVIGAIVALGVGFVVGLVANNDDNGDPAAAPPAADAAAPPAQNRPANAAQGGDGASGGGSGLDLRKGAVFVQSNSQHGNEVVALARGEDGKLSEVGRYDTGGTGSGSFEDSANGVILGTANGEAAPQHNIDNPQLLFVTNAGSNSVTVFRVTADSLQLVETLPSGGEKPVSLTVNRGLLYVLNSGELDDRLVLRRPVETNQDLLDNCTHGEPPTVTGFRVGEDGDLSEIANSTRPLSGGQGSGCSQVSFTQDGSQLVVTERVATLPGKTADKGAIVTFDVNDDGLLGAKKVMDPSGTGPFGFAFTKDGTLLVSEQKHSEPGQSTTSSYTMREDGTLKAISKSVGNQGTDNCWVVVTSDSRMAFTSNAFGGGTISSYRIDENGALSLLQSSATAEPGKDINDDRLTDGTTDLSLSRDSEFLYQLNSNLGIVQVFRVNDNGTLGFVEDKKVFDVPGIDTTGQLAPYGIAAF